MGDGAPVRELHRAMVERIQPLSPRWGDQHRENEETCAQIRWEVISVEQSIKIGVLAIARLEFLAGFSLLHEVPGVEMPRRSGKRAVVLTPTSHVDT